MAGSMSGPSVQAALEAAMAAHRRGDLVSANAGYQDVLRRQPDNPDALHLHGAILANTDPESGAALIQRSLALRPGSKEAHINLGNIAARRLRMEDAEHHFRDALALDPDAAAAAAGLGGALLHLGAYPEAEQRLRHAAHLRPSDPTTLINLGILLDTIGRFDDAVALYDRALALHPENVEAHQHKALALLVRGRLAEGWKEYEWRLRSIASFAGRFPYPTWAGQPLNGLKILVWMEQGLGDQILMTTLLPDLLALGARPVVLCAPRLAALFRRSFPAIAFIGFGEKPDDPSIVDGIAFQASFSDLGLHLRPDRTSFAGTAPVLKDDQNLTQRLREKYRAMGGGKLVVGVSWRSKNQKSEEVKSIALQAWAPLLRLQDVAFLNLQYGDTKEDLAFARSALGVDILSDPDIDPLGDLDAFASQVAAVDLVISVSNTTVHVAGALGRPTWIFVPSTRGRMWYWFLERADSVWYRDARLFRQEFTSDWERPIAEAAHALAGLSRGHQESPRPTTP